MERGPRALDDEITRLLAEGRITEAASRAIEGYGPHVRDFVFAILRDEDAAEEAYAQFSEDLWKGIGHFRGDCRFRTWVYRLGHNVVLRHWKDPFRRRGRRLATSEVSQLPAGEREATRSYQRTTLKEALRLLRERLPPEEQTLLILRVDQRMSWREIALVISSPDAPLAEGALRQRFERLKRRLREIALEEGLLQQEEDN